MDENIKVFANNSVKLCPFCKSDNILPFEEENKYEGDPPISIIVFTALGILAVYVSFVIASYLFFPVVVFVLIIVATRILNKTEKHKQRNPNSDGKKYLCLNCDRSFNVTERKGT